MAVSRIAFALYDLAQEVKRLVPGTEAQISIAMDHVTADAVVRELEHHHGAAIQKDREHRGLGQAWRYSGMRLVSLPPGNR